VDSKMKRRDFLKISALASVAVVAAACAPTATPTAAPTAASNATAAATTAPKATAAATTATTAVPKATEVPKATAAPKVAFQGKITFYASGFMPTSETQNPDPKAPKREAMKTLSTDWLALHPGVTMEFVPAPTGDYFSWLTTQLIGGTGPDIYWIWLSSANQNADQGKAVPLDDYLELPNKYSPSDNTAWKNTFKDPFLTFYKNNHYGGIPIDLVATGIYANVDMLKQVGIDVKAEIVPELSSPKDWATMMSWCQKLIDGGFLAMSAGAGVINQWWITGVLSDQFLYTWIDKYDLLNYHTDTPVVYQKGILSQEEVVHAVFCKGLDVYNSPEVRDMFRVIADWCKYMPPGFANADFGTPVELFLTGKLGMVWDGSWSVGTILQDNRRQFEFTSFWLPPVTKATSEFVSDPPHLPIGVGGYGSTTYCLNPTTIKKGDVDDCVDWLMYITTPKNDEIIVNEVPSTIPSNKQAKALPEVENLFVGETRFAVGGQHPISGPYSWFGWQEDKWGDLLRREETLYFLGESTQDVFFANLKATGDTLAKEVIRQSSVQYTKAGLWDLTQWSCQPTV
jgi:ABC-type glycerol-3-phosphate transport system substrate-binding protein